MITVELLPSPDLEAAIRSDWERLRSAGLPGLADHPHPSNRPHLTLVTAASLDGLPPLPLPVPVTLGAPVLLGRALVRPASVPAELHEFQSLTSATLPGAWPPPGEWVPHISLALRASPAASALLADLPPLLGDLVAARSYDTVTRTVSDHLARRPRRRGPPR